MDKDELIKFWKLFTSGFGSRNFLKDSSTLVDRVFFYSLAQITGKLIGSLENTKKKLYLFIIIAYVILRVRQVPAMNKIAL